MSKNTFKNLKMFRGETIAMQHTAEAQNYLQFHFYIEWF